MAGLSIREIRIEYEADDALGASPHAEVHQTIPPLCEEVDLGVTAVVNPPLLVAGVVLDNNSSPIAEATISVDGMYWRDGLLWSDQIGDLTGVSDASGSFEIRGSPLCEFVRVQASHERYALRQPLDVELGSRDVLLTMMGTGGIHVEVLVEGDPRLSIVAQGPQVASLVTWGGRAELDGMLAGEYDVEVRSAQDEVFARIDGVVVRVGEVVLPNPVDLRGRLRELCFVIVDREGNRVKAQLRHRRSGSGTYHSALSCEVDLPACLTTMYERMDLSVASLEHRTRTLNEVRSGRTIVLDDGLALSVGFDGEAPSLLPGERLKVLVSSVSGEGDVVRWADFDEQGCVVTHLPHVGRYRLAVYLSHQMGEDVLPGLGDIPITALEGVDLETRIHVSQDLLDEVR